MPERERWLEMLLAFAVCLIALGVVCSAIFDVLTVYSLGGLIGEMQQDRTEARKTRLKILQQNDEQTAALNEFARQSQRAATVLCQHVKPKDRPLMSCPELR